MRNLNDLISEIKRLEAISLHARISKLSNETLLRIYFCKGTFLQLLRAIHVQYRRDNTARLTLHTCAQRLVQRLPQGLHTVCKTRFNSRSSAPLPPTPFQINVYTQLFSCITSSTTRCRAPSPDSSEFNITSRPYNVSFLSMHKLTVN